MIADEFVFLFGEVGDEGEDAEVGEDGHAFALGYFFFGDGVVFLVGGCHNLTFSLFMRVSHFVLTSQTILLEKESLQRKPSSFLKTEVNSDL